MSVVRIRGMIFDRTVTAEGATYELVGVDSHLEIIQAKVEAYRSMVAEFFRWLASAIAPPASA